MLKPKKSVETMEGYFVPMYERLWNVKADGNENNYGPSPVVMKALSEIRYTDVCFYPYYGELTEKISRYRDVPFECIKVTNGADEALQSIIQTYLNPGEALLTVNLSFSMPEIYTQIQGGKVISVPFEEKWKFPVKSFIEQLKNPEVKVVYLCSPNNPTGSIVEEADFLEIMKHSADRVVIIDETYANYSDFTFDKYFLEYDNLFAVHSFSKDFALAGLRLGYIITASENVNNLKKVVSPYTVNSLAMKAALAALSDTEYFNSLKKEVNQTKAELKSFLETLGGIVYDSTANFLLVDFGNKAEYVYAKLKSRDIIVKLFKKGHLLENHLRVTIPTRQGFEEIKNALALKPSLVFDMDGVLVNAGNSYRVAIQKVYEKYTGKTVTEQEIQAVKNMGGMNNDWDLTDYLLKKEGVEIPYGEIVDVFNSFYWGTDGSDGLINNEEKLFDTDFFKELSKDYNVSIYTGRSRKEAEYALSRFGARDIFLFVITSDDVLPGREKPYPDGLEILKEKTISSKYYYFGDTVDDIKAAKSAGYVATGVLPPQDKSDNLVNIMKNADADFVIKNVSELKTVVEDIYEAKH